MIALYLLILIAWTACCVWAGQVWEIKRRMREDYNQWDAWADRYQHEHEGAA